MIDICQVTTDPEGFTDDVFDVESMQYFQKPSDRSPVYTGKCIISPEGNLPQSQPLGEGAIIETLYRLRTPIEFPGFITNDLVVCISSVRNPGLAGLRFLVVEETFSSFSVSRTHRLVRKTRVGPGSAALLPD